MEYKKESYAAWKNSSNQISYLFYKTKDNSVSLSLQSEDESTELMHSVDGAFSETVYLYEDIVKTVLNNSHVNNKNVFLSLGLGLGYVEILVTAYFLKNCPSKKFKIYSYEKKEDLRCFFKKFIFGEEIPFVFYECYKSIVVNFCQLYSLQEEQLLQELKNRILNQEILFCEDYHLNTQIPEKINGLFFDAFSIKTSPDLWEDELIHQILNACDSNACFATYACRSHLKKLLVSHHFILQKKKGYGGKKQSTFAYRNGEI